MSRTQTPQTIVSAPAIPAPQVELGFSILCIGGAGWAKTLRARFSLSVAILVHPPAELPLNIDAVLTSSRYFLRVRALIAQSGKARDALAGRGKTSPLLALVCAQPDEVLDSLEEDEIMLPPQQGWMLSILRQTIHQRRKLEGQRHTLERDHHFALTHALKIQREQLTTQNEARQRSGDATKLLKDAIIHNVAHELGTPMLHLKSAVSQLQEISEAQELAHYALEATSRLEGVIANITGLRTWESVRLEPIFIGDSIDYAMRTLKRSFANREKMGRIRVHLDQSLPPVIGDKKALGVVIHHLVDNALKFSEKTVDIRVSNRGDTLCIAVGDEGIGIPPAHQQTIFEAFVQLDSTSTRPYGGSGTGLAVVQLILEQHDTQIEIESDSNVGSIFRFSLPILLSSPITKTTAHDLLFLT